MVDDLVLQHGLTCQLGAWGACAAHSSAMIDLVRCSMSACTTHRYPAGRPITTGPQRFHGTLGKHASALLGQRSSAGQAAGPRAGTAAQGRQQASHVRVELSMLCLLQRHCGVRQYAACAAICVDVALANPDSGQPLASGCVSAARPALYILTVHEHLCSKAQRCARSVDSALQASQH